MSWVQTKHPANKQRRKQLTAPFLSSVLLPDSDLLASSRIPGAGCDLREERRSLVMAGVPIFLFRKIFGSGIKSLQ